MTTTIPDLDNDTLTYSFPKQSDGVRPVYKIRRSINGGPLVTIGTTVKLRDGDWSRTAWWEATSGDLRVTGDTRAKAVRDLEFRLQGPAYAERKQQEYRDHLARDAEARAIALAADAATLADAIERFPVAADLLAGVTSLDARLFTARQVIDLLNERTTS